MGLNPDWSCLMMNQFWPRRLGLFVMLRPLSARSPFRGPKGYVCCLLLFERREEIKWPRMHQSDVRVGGDKCQGRHPLRKGHKGLSDVTLG